jgi:hypothetical protein|tara:strand:+ start:4254 stop:5000 length:747 start_codon:yes stop_codon:yes gene_type:complete
MCIKRLSQRLAVSIMGISLTMGAQASEFAGRWASDFGELRLHQTDGVIIGDYAQLGILFGEVSGEKCASGVFTNGGRFGEFSFRIVEEGEILGRYRWNGGSTGSRWDATRTSSSVPSDFANFTRSGGSTIHIENDNQVFNGTYASTYGPLRLRDSDLFLYGDYANRGVIAARWNGRKYEGVFTNRELSGNQVGWLEWSADVLARNLTGGTYKIIDSGSGNWAISDFQPGNSVFQNVAVSGTCAPMWPF